MFVKLQQRIVATIVAVTVIFCLAVSLTTAVVISQSYVATFEDGVAEAVRIAVEYSGIKLDTILSDGVKIAADDGILTGLSRNDYVTSINPKLNYFRSQYQEEIVGLTIYGENGFLYKTDSLPIASIEPFATLSALPAIAAFIASTETELTTIVFRDTPELQVRYFTIIVKIGGTDRLGYLFINIDPDYLFAEYFGFEAYESFGLIAHYVRADGIAYHPSANRVDTTHISLTAAGTDAYFTAGYRSYVVSEPLYAEAYQLVTVAGTEPLWHDITVLGVVLATMDVLIVVVAFIIARRHAAFIIARLEKLREKMRQAPTQIE
ncbi:MAG: hypothetical protein V1761_02385 [bacterium]